MTLLRPPLEHWLTFHEAREMLGVSRSMMYDLLWEHALDGYKVRNTWRFLPEDLAACQEAQSTRFQRAASKRTNKLDSITACGNAQESPLISSCVVDTTHGREALSWRQRKARNGIPEKDGENL